jgi:hypothetical protein
MTLWRMRIAYWIRKAIDTLRICNIYCFSTAIKVAGMRLIVTLYVHCPSCCLQIYITLSEGQAVEVWEISFGYRGALAENIRSRNIIFKSLRGAERL